MKKRIVISCCLSLLLIISITLSGCSCSIGPEIMEEGNFKYSLLKISEKRFSQIEGLTEKGAKQKILVLPETLGDYAVYSVGVPIFLTYRGEWESDNLEKLFVPIKVEMEIYFDKCPNLKKIIMVRRHVFFDKVGIRQYMSSYNIDLIENETNYFGGIEYCSNISYMYNYEESPNDGYYWIDDLEYGSKIEWKPEEPRREGYTFGGWYKEEECINAWDFATDKLPEEQRTEIGLMKYQETRLYAKWV